MKTQKTVLTIAGSDPSGGAGVQADIKTIGANQLFGTSVITSITSQNTLGVQETFDLPVNQVESQLKSILSDTPPKATKTGMLGNAEIVECVSRNLKRARIRNLVVDPVLRSSNGKVLLSKEGVRVLQEKLLPLAVLVTPNLKEAEVLSGIKIRKPADRRKAARIILKSGVKNVLIKGGHARGNPDDFLFDGKRSRVFEGERLTREDLHGTGCVLSAAIASGLALGLDVPTAIERAKSFIENAIRLAAYTGKGVGSVDPLAETYQHRERLELIQQVADLVEEFKAQRIGNLIPEVQTNIGVGLTGASSPDDVVGIPGRVVRKGRDVYTVSAPEFGASQHVAKIVLTAMRFDPSRRAVMNIKFTDGLLKICRKLKFSVGTFRRSDEPKNVKQLEGSSLEWGTHQAIKDCGYVPDIIFDLGGQGKEEMIRVLAKDVDDLRARILKIHSLAEKELPARETDRWRKK